MSIYKKIYDIMCETKALPTKVCTKCDRELPATLEYFSRNSRAKCGLQPKCKECNRKYHYENQERIQKRRKEYYENNKEILSEKGKEYRERNADKIKARREGNKECIREYNRRYRLENPDYFKEYKETNADYIKEQNKKYYQENKERIREYRREYLRKNIDKKREYAREHREKNPEWYKEYYKWYHKENPDKRSVWWQARRARQESLVSDFTNDEWKSAQEHFDNRCAYCGNETKLTQDHFIPVSAGGGYTKSNIIPACGACNSSKHDVEFEDWYRRNEHYSPERESKIWQYLELMQGE